ncbi:Phosphoserine phosphatase 1 [Pirellulimonas nuda]|uniref:Phosphoserine phosphatase 1 n=1 Tax=Pirellulimonas nuda TaxID=2528009 RepID=A0A518D8V4_9BACT|nr:histidine phosphatase family protein [Pirellulimonas nuda]QDU87903.1 Phosphoserine phosphatase 1 [Pirellulimonas nuda]
MQQRLYLIRHGQTEWSLNGRHTGSSDIPLTTQGEDQARRLGEQLCLVRFAHVFTSPLRRARETCELAGLVASAQVDADLREWDYGEQEGLTSREIHAVRPAWNLFRDGGSGGESPTQVAGRADRVIERLRRLEGNIAIFSHGHFGRVLGVRWIGWSVQQAQHLLLDTASISTLGLDDKHANTPVLAVWNYTNDALRAEP